MEVFNLEKKSPLVIGVSIYDSKPFNMLTTGSYALKLETGGTKDKQRYDIQHKFNQYMNGVDVSDQLQSSYNTYVKSRKWWLRLFFFLLDIAIVNAYVIAKILDPTLTHLNFREKLVAGLVEKYKTTETHTEKRNAADLTQYTPAKRIRNDLPSIRLADRRHDPFHTESKRCVVCTRKKGKSMTVIGCSICQVNLCVKEGSDCWAEWHSSDFS